ncbi:MAG: hypothetical protein ACYSWQ_29550, partial [Planctomycetota bacterium]
MGKRTSRKSKPTDPASDMPDQPLDVLIVTAAPGEDTGVKAVDEGAVGPWEETDGPEGYGFKVWFRDYKTESGTPLRVAVTRAADLGVEAAAIAAASLANVYRPRCLAMCGVCAGRPGWTNLGDVIIADNVYRYDVGEEEKEKHKGKTIFYADTITYPIRAQWRQAGQNLRIAPDVAWLSERPRPRSMQGDWVLHELDQGRDPLVSVERDTQCKDWTEVVKDLQERKLMTLAGGEPAPTDEGTNYIRNLLFEHRGKLPEQEPWAIHVGPLGTGSKLVRSVDIWDRLRQNQRQVTGLDMEASVMGLVAHIQNVSRWIVVKGVMDHAEPDRNYGFRPFAARAAGEVLLGFLRQHLEPGDRKT